MIAPVLDSHSLPLVVAAFIDPQMIESPFDPQMMLGRPEDDWTADSAYATIRPEAL
jgi:hypothetical protein